MTPLALGFVGTGKRLEKNDIAAAAARLGCSVPALSAVVDVEASGAGFDALNRPKVLFEPHIFHRELASEPVLLQAARKAGLAYERQGSVAYPPGSEAQYQRIKRASLIDPAAALRSASWGLGQVMGFNFASGGFASPEAMVLACMEGEARQLDLMLGYIEKHGLHRALAKLDFRAFARGYNGPGAVALYAGKLQLAHDHHAKLLVPDPGQASKPPMILVGNPLKGGPLLVRAHTGGLAKPPVSADSLNDLEWLRVRAGVGDGAP